MRLDIEGFRQTKDCLGRIHDMCSLARLDPSTSDERRAEVVALERWLCCQRYDQGFPNGLMRDEASRRAAALLDAPELLVGVPPEPPVPIEPALS